MPSLYSDAASEHFRKCTTAVYTETTSTGGIGTLGERMLHACLKRYICPDVTCHEVKVGRYHADVLIQGHIYEIQTRRLDRLRTKLETLLPKYPVTVVYPVSAKTTLAWLDPNDGTLSTPRRSPKKGKLQAALYELYGLGDLLLHPNFSLRVILCDTEEFRILSGYGTGRKRRAPRAERIPTALVEDYLFNSPSEYETLLPPELKEPFTSKELCHAMGLHPNAAWRSLHTLLTLGLIEQVGKQGRAFLYRRVSHGGV